MTTPITAPVLLTVEQVAERMNCKPRFVRRLIAERRIEFIKASRVPPMDASVIWRHNRRVA